MNQTRRFRLVSALVVMLLSVFSTGAIPQLPAAPTNVDDSTLLVKRTGDFSVTGDGSNPAWSKTVWHSLTKLDRSGPDYGGRFKILYSDSGIYVLFAGGDKRITTDKLEDMSEIYEGDAFEVFMLPDTARGVYFEYEINPVGKQLVLVLAKQGKKRPAWIPWGKSPVGIDRKVKVSGGEMHAGAGISSWTAELFFSSEVLNIISGMPPRKGDTWLANLCRLDYDNGKPPAKWSWSPGIVNSFHELDKFRRLKFD